MTTPADATLRLLHAIVENIPVMVFLKDAEHLRFELFNKAGQELVGVSFDDLRGKCDHDLFPKEQADFFTANDRRVLAEGKVVAVDEPIQTKQGERWLLTKKIPIRGPTGEPTHLLGVSLDITDRRAAEAEQARLNTTLREALEQLLATEGLAAAGYAALGTAREVARALSGGAYEEAQRLVHAFEEAGQVSAAGGQCDVASALAPLAGRATLLNVEPLAVAMSADGLRRAVDALASFVVRRRGTVHEIATLVNDGVPILEISAPGLVLTPVERAGFGRIDADAALAARIVHLAGGSLTAEKRGAGTALHLRLVPLRG